MIHQNKSALIIGAGIAGPMMALHLQTLGITATVYESRAVDDLHGGAFLGITPNGLHILNNFIDIQALKSNYTPAKMRFYNARSEEIAELDDVWQREKYGVETIQIKRADLHEIVRKKAVESGIRIEFGKKLVDLSDTGNGVTASFADGSQARADFMLACDGAFSTVRKHLFPETAHPRYTRMISTGGYATLPGMADQFGAIQMTFGDRAFFAYAVSNHGEVWWFNNYFREREPAHDELRSILPEEIRAHLLDLHAHDDPILTRIIRASTEIFAYPIYDLPHLANWWSGRVCLLGDAAHAVSPHVGQGASLALEDTAVLTRCLAEAGDLTAAFTRFQQLRQPRVEKIVRSARKIGQAKARPNPVANWFRDRLLRYFIRGEIKKLDWVYGYRAGTERVRENSRPPSF